MTTILIWVYLHCNIGTLGTVRMNGRPATHFKTLSISEKAFGYRAYVDFYIEDGKLHCAGMLAWPYPKKE